MYRQHQTQCIDNTKHNGIQHQTHVIYNTKHNGIDTAKHNGIQHQTQWYTAPNTMVYSTKHNGIYNKVPPLGPKKRAPRFAVKCNLIINETVVERRSLPLRDSVRASPRQEKRPQMQKGEENHYKGTLKAMESSGVIGTASCAVVPFEMHLIANRKEERERQQCEGWSPFLICTD